MISIPTYPSVRSQQLHRTQIDAKDSLILYSHRALPSPPIDPAVARYMDTAAGWVVEAGAHAHCAGPWGGETHRRRLAGEDGDGGADGEGGGSSGTANRWSRRLRSGTAYHAPALCAAAAEDDDDDDMAATGHAGRRIRRRRDDAAARATPRKAGRSAGAAAAAAVVGKSERIATAATAIWGPRS